MPDGQMRTIKLDIDIPYELFMDKFYDIFRSKMFYCTILHNLIIDSWKITKSRKSGNVHVHIVLAKPVTPELYFKLKYCMGEDHRRLVWSYRRYKKTGKILDFFWNKPIELKKGDKCGKACIEK